MCTFAPVKSPDGGIGRRAGLKHQWGNPSRFEPGSGYNNNLKNACKPITYRRFCFSIEQKTSKNKQHPCIFAV